MAAREFQLLVVGGFKTGKTSFLRRLHSGEFEMEYNPTLGYELYTLDFPSNYGTIRFHCLDTPVQEDVVVPQQMFTDAQGAILMFDVCSSLRNVLLWCDDLRWYNENMPIVSCRNKVDLTSEDGPGYDIICLSLEENLHHIDVSVKNHHNLKEPFLYFARKFTGHADLVFGESSAPIPAGESLLP